MNPVTKGEFAPAPVRWFLARLMAHTELDDEEQRAILRLHGQAAEVRAGGVIAVQGTTIVHSHLVARGILAQFDEASDGRRKATRLFVPGDMCGLQTVECPTIAWGLCAFTSCTVLHVPHDELRKLVNRFSGIRRALWREMAIDASVRSKWTGNAALKNGAERAAHLICELSLRMERVGLCDRNAFNLDASQPQLCQALGLTPVHTNRVLGELRRKGLISTGRRAITVGDWNGLRKLAEFDPAYLY